MTKFKGLASQLAEPPRLFHAPLARVEYDLGYSYGIYEADQGLAVQKLRPMLSSEELADLDIIWAGPHRAGEDCGLSNCSEIDYRARRTSYENGSLIEFEKPYKDDPDGPGADRLFCHTQDRIKENWTWFTDCELYVEEI